MTTKQGMIKIVIMPNLEHLIIRKSKMIDSDGNETKTIYEAHLLGELKETKERLSGMDNEMTASEALYGFMGWLTSRYKVTPELSAKHDAGIAAQLVGEFCEENKLSIPRDGWENKLIHPSGECSNR